LTPAGTRLVDNASTQHDALRKSFVDQTRLDLQNFWIDVDDGLRDRAVELAIQALVEIFDERGVELVNAVLGGAEVAGRRSGSLFATISRVGAELDDESLKYRFVTYMAELLTQPREQQRGYIEHLALSFFSLHALAMDPAGHRFRQEYLSGRTLLVDSNVLIPLVPANGIFSDDLTRVVEMARQAGMPLATTHGFIEELYVHGMWATRLVEEHGETSVQVLEAARGEGYKHNTFLDGYVRYSVDVKHLRFVDYLRQCLGGREFDRDGIREHLAEAYGVECLDFDRIASRRQTAFVERGDTEDYIRQEAEERSLDKADTRVRAEAEAYAIVANWEAPAEGELIGVGNTGIQGQRLWDIGVLSQGGFFNRIARHGPHPLGRQIVVPPDALYGFLIQTGAAPQRELSFREMMVSHLFDTSSHFLDRERYRKFFWSLINDAERIYREHLASFQEEIDASLRPEFFDDVEPLDRPYFVDSFQTQLKEKLKAAQATAATAQQQLKTSQERLRESESSKEKLAKQLHDVEIAVTRKARKKAERQERRSQSRKRK
jgi:hypothetical protein